MPTGLPMNPKAGAARAKARALNHREKQNHKLRNQVKAKRGLILKAQLGTAVLWIAALLLASCSPNEAADRGRLTASSPSNQATDVALDTTITLTFSEILKVETLTIQSESGPCDLEMNILISADGFSSCHGATVEVLANSSQRKAEITLTSNLEASTVYAIMLLNKIDFAHFGALEETVFSFTTSAQGPEGD